MSKRYTYFRDPQGKPYKKQDGKHTPLHILKEIGTSSTKQDEKHVSWPPFIHRCSVALRASCVVIGPDDAELNDTDAWRIVWDALVSIVKAAPGKAVNPAGFLEKADASAAEFFRKEPEKYVLVTALSLAALPAKNITVQGCIVSPLPNGRGKKFPIPEVVRRQGPGSLFASHLESTKYLTVTVRTRGRSPHEGASVAMNALNLLRGLWSHFARYGSWSMSFGSPQRKPIGIIHAGPVHTLHHPDGKLVSEDFYWYDPSYTGDRPLFEMNSDWPKIEKNRKWALKKMAHLPYRIEMEELLTRYVAALDQTDPDVAFLQMWSILERITNTVGGKYDETIDRVAWLYAEADRPLVKEILESLRHCRNQYVHSGRTTPEGDQVAYLVKSYLDPHLRRLITNAFTVRSLEEYGKVLALSTNTIVLEQQYKKIGMALRMMKGARANDTPPAEAN